jgi:hypothetical protein
LELAGILKHGVPRILITTRNRAKCYLWSPNPRTEMTLFSRLFDRGALVRIGWSSSKKYKQVPENDDCIKCQKYHCNCVYGSGFCIVFNP